MIARRTALMATVLSLLSGAQQAVAAECLQGHAVYADRDNVYELAFEPVDSEASSSSHIFKMTIRNSKAVLDGYVMPSEPVDRPNGMLFFNCPDGDVTGDDLAACTVWQGVIYSNDGGNIGLLPASGEKAAQQLLLPGLGPSIRDSGLWDKAKLTVAPWDVLTFKECRS